VPKFRHPSLKNATFLACQGHKSSVTDLETEPGSSNPLASCLRQEGKEPWSYNIRRKKYHNEDCAEANLDAWKGEAQS